MEIVPLGIQCQGTETDFGRQLEEVYIYGDFDNILVVRMELSLSPFLIENIYWIFVDVRWR